MLPDLPFKSPPLPLPRIIATLLVAVTITCSALAGEFNPTRNIGDVVPAWSGLPGTDGRKHSWEDLADTDAVVVVFTCNDCPYAVDYEERINDLAIHYAGQGERVAVVAINSNQAKSESLEAIQERARARDFRFPYLIDASQEVSRTFGALRTPEFFVLDGSRRIVYMGAMDDDTQESLVRHRHVADALEAVLAGRPVELSETAPVGCLITTARRRDAR